MLWCSVVEHLENYYRSTRSMWSSAKSESEGECEVCSDVELRKALENRVFKDDNTDDRQ